MQTRRSGSGQGCEDASGTEGRSFGGNHCNRLRCFTLTYNYIRSEVLSGAPDTKILMIVRRSGIR